jgi:hypothetical protein
MNIETDTTILQPNKKNNGRVNIRDPDMNNLFQMYDKIPANQCTTYREPTLGQWDATELSKIYFSKENIQIIQNAIRAGVYNKSNGQYIVDQQDCESLKIIMRSIFLQYSVNNPNNIREQVESLNKMVLDYSIPQVYGEAQGHMKYLNDVSTLPVPIAMPALMSQHDKRSYRMPNWF